MTLPCFFFPLPDTEAPWQYQIFFILVSSCTFNVSSWFKTLETVAAEKPVRSAISFIVAILNPSLHDTFQYFSNRISYVSAFHGLSYHIAHHATNCYDAVSSVAEFARITAARIMIHPNIMRNVILS